MPTTPTDYKALREDILKTVIEAAKKATFYHTTWESDDGDFSNKIPLIDADLFIKALSEALKQK